MQERKAGTGEIKDGSKGLIDLNPPRGGPAAYCTARANYL